MTNPSSEREALTVIVGPAGPLVGIRAVLHDWTSAGLLRNGSWVWADATLMAKGASDVLLAEGGFIAQNLRVLIARRNPEIVRVLALQPFFEGEPDDAAALQGSAMVANMVAESAAGARIVRAHLFITRRSAHRPPPVVPGWHNIVVSPEDAYGPGDAVLSLPDSDGPNELGLHAAPTVAALGALHAGVAASPLDDAAVLPGGQARVVRTFVSRIDATGIEDRLRAQLISMADGLPLLDPTGRESTYIEDVRAASAEMAEHVKRRHNGLLMGPRVRPKQEKPQAIGILDALKMLFGFVVAAIKNAPMQWWKGKVTRVRARLAAGVSDFVYGADENSAYRVVVKGIGADGMPADWEETLDGLAVIETTINASRGNGAHAEHEDLAQLWQDTVVGALTLLDGAPRRDYLPPIQIGARKGILRRGANCVPPRSEAFTAFPGQIASLLPHQRIEPTDVLAVRSTHARLKQLASDPQTGPLAAETLENLERWRSRVGQTYGSRVRSIFGEAFEQRRVEIAQYLAILEAASKDTTADEKTRAIQSRLARRMRWLSIGFALVAIAIGVVTGLQVIGWALGLALVAATVLSWFVSALLVFARGQRELFRQMNQRALAVSQAQAAETNLVEAVRDARRLGDAYALCGEWMRILGVFCEQPLGESRSGEAAGSKLHGTMPLSMGLGVAISDELAIVAAAQGLRGRIFRSGWASEAWNAGLEAAPRQLGMRGVALLTDPTAIYHQRRTQEDRLLQLWSDRLETDGILSGAAETFWQLALQDLWAGTTPQAGALVGAVELGSGRDLRRVAPAEIFADFEQPASKTGRPDLFTPEPFSSTALVHGSHAVRENWARIARTGLGQVAVLVQSSEGLQAADLSGHADTTFDSTRAPGDGAIEF